MSLRLFRNFPQAWDKYEQQIRIEFLKRFQTNNAYRPEVHPHALSDLFFWHFTALTKRTVTIQTWKTILFAFTKEPIEMWMHYGKRTLNSFQRIYFLGRMPLVNKY